MAAEGDTAVHKGAYDAGKDKTKEPRKLSVPKFRSKTFKQLREPKNMYPRIEESVFKFYDFSGDNTANAEGKRPYIIFLDGDKVDAACNKEKKEYFKNIGGLTLKILVGVIVMAFVVGCFLKLAGLI